jgi:hypothetical protein
LQKAIPGKKRASFAEALLSQIPVIKYDSAIPAIDAPERNTWETNLKNEVISDLFDSREGFYILKSSSTSAFTVSNLKVYSLWCYINSENMLFNVINQIATEVEGIEIAEEIS